MRGKQEREQEGKERTERQTERTRERINGGKKERDRKRERDQERHRWGEQREEGRDRKRGKAGSDRGLSVQSSGAGGRPSVSRAALRRQQGHTGL